VAENAPASPNANPLDSAADRLRDAAKWLLASFGAVAVVVFAGLTVADLGDLDGDTPGYRLQIAVVAAAAAIIGIVAALSHAMGLAGAATTSLDDLTGPTGEEGLAKARAQAAKDPALTTWGGDIDAFLTDYRTAYDEYVQTAEAYAADPAKQPSTALLRKAQFHQTVLSSIATRILRTVSFLRLQHAFLRARRMLAVWTIVTATGAVAFGWATSGIADEPPSLTDRPVAGTLQPGKAVVEELNRQLPAGCGAEVGDELAVIVVADDEDAETLALLTVPTGSCPPVRVTAPADQVTDG
jgi:hypothetical protein